MSEKIPAHKQIHYNSCYKVFSYQDIAEGGRVLEMRPATHQEIYESMNHLNDIIFLDLEKLFKPKGKKTKKETIYEKKKREERELKLNEPRCF